jgi:preprotein translocase YajC subunit
MYVLLVRPQQRKVREQRELVRRVGVGAEVQTIGGILGRVVAADDEYVHLEVSPGIVVTFVRAAVGRILEAAPDEPDLDWGAAGEAHDGAVAPDAEAGAERQDGSSGGGPRPADPEVEPHVELPSLREEHGGPDAPAEETEGGAG